MTNRPIPVTIVLAILAILVTTVIMLVTFVFDQRPSAGSTVEQYLQAIAVGDASAANDLFDPQLIGAEHFPTALNDTTSFMSDKALSAATERISDIEIVRFASATRADVAVVFISYSLGGESFEDGLSLRWKDGKWQLKTGLWQILQVRPNFSETGSAPRVVKVNLGDITAISSLDFNESGSFIAYPGVYPLSLEAPGWVADEPFDEAGEARLVTPTSTFVVRPRFRVYDE